MSEELPPPFSTPLPQDRKGRQELFEERAVAFSMLKAERAAAAESRGRQLLLSLLDEEQGRMLEDLGFFEVTGSEGGLFRISVHGNSGNVHLIDPAFAGKEDGRAQLFVFCAHFEPEPDEFLRPYLKTLANGRRGEYCCRDCNGMSRANWQEMLTGKDFDPGQYWPDPEIKAHITRHLCQSDLMIGQMLKIQADEVGWWDVAVRSTCSNVALGQAHVEKINALRVQRRIEAEVGKRVAEFGIEPAIAAGPLTIRIRDSYYGTTTTRTVRVTETGGWEVIEPEPTPPPAQAPVDPARVPAAYRFEAGPWNRVPQRVNVNVDAQEAFVRVGEAIQEMGAAFEMNYQTRQVQAVLNDEQLRILRELMGR